MIRTEDAVQRFEFIHIVKTDAQTAGLAMLWAQQKRMQEELSGFRAEVAAEFGALKSEFGALRSDTSAEFASVRAELDGMKATLTEILRRLPERP